MDKEYSKYVVSKDSLELISNIYSNHPKREMLGEKGFEKIEDNNINLINLRNWERFNDTVNIVFGDSHAEYLGRLFKEVASSLKKEQRINRTFCFWTGATTVVGSIQSNSYYNNLIRSLVLIIEKLRAKLVFKKLNLIISLGEIDVRTKLFLESKKNNISVENVILDYCNEKLIKKLTLLREGINSLYEQLDVTIYFKSPPPPSSSLPVTTPKTGEELRELFKKVSYPALLPLEERGHHYEVLCQSIKKACLMSGIKFLKSNYTGKNILESDMSYDGIHISKGEWAIKNSEQIFIEI